MKWGKDIKEMIQYASAMGMLLVGSILATIALWKNDWHEIPESVLWMTAQCLIYAGSVFGVSIVINYKFGKIMSMIGDNKFTKDGNEQGSDSKNQGF